MQFYNYRKGGDSLIVIDEQFDYMNMAKFSFKINLYFKVLSK